MRVVLSNTSSKAIYEQIADQVKDSIMKGELSPGDALPSIRALARDLRISVITTKRAYEELEKEKYIETIQGKGSFIAAQDNELMREKRLNIIEEKLMDAIMEARILGLELIEINEILKVLWEE
ncbi:MAG: GntR family transcriptional regulator [Tissierellia bacterium]|nr:GntR family transcriptional regulator [Tissierellia bacterium]